jgi:type IV pilus assembly protein PilY1
LTVPAAGHISRATPTLLANVMFSASMETPAADWTSAELRGHLKSTRIYDSNAPSQTDTLELWDAGDVLKNQMSPSGRTIYIPDVTVQAVDSGSAEQLATGDGVTTTFSGRLAHYPVLATTVRISDVSEIFSDRHTDELRGSLGGSGKINRFTGHYSITFDDPPNPNQPVRAEYSYFIYNSGTLSEFKENLVSAAELGLDDSIVIPSGYVYDLDNDGAFSAADANWLINWTRGYRDGNTKVQEKEWTLGALDHSVPAVATPPAPAPWYYGTAFPEDKHGSTQDRQGYRDFRDAHAGRRTVVYVGARDGMLHAFDTGVFRWGDNPCTGVSEQRGYFKWTDPNDSSPDACVSSCSGDCEADYGTGEELWAFIPANLLPRLKNNYLQGEDRSFVDASPALADVHIDGSWRTVLLSAEGNGGDTIYCLDVTDPANPKFMWEFADPDLFRSRSSPAVARIGRIYHEGTAKWVAFFVSGKTFDDTRFPSIFVIDIADGSLLQKINMDAMAVGAGGVLSGQPSIVDSDGNGYVDRLYIGSDKGLLYKINMPDDPSTLKFAIGHCVINTDFSDREDNSVTGAWQYQPIYATPTVVASNSVDAIGQMMYDIRIFFGTGDSPFYDENIDFDNTRYVFYAYRDTSAKGQCDDTAEALDWFYELEEGHRIYASAFAAAGNIYFGTSTGETEDPCDLSANSDADFDANAGKLYVFDMDNPDGVPLLERVVGNVLAAPVVEDQHVYVQSVGGDVDSFGSGQYNNATRQGGIPEIKIHWWREMF